MLHLESIVNKSGHGMTKAGQLLEVQRAEGIGQYDCIATFVMLVREIIYANMHACRYTQSTADAKSCL